LVLGGERSGVSPEVIDAADTVVAVPMLGMANSLNVATTAAILFYWLSLHVEEPEVCDPL
jgi:RNA methyltransferase, TrmH family